MKIINNYCDLSVFLSRRISQLEYYTIKNCSLNGLIKLFKNIAENIVFVCQVFVPMCMWSNILVLCFKQDLHLHEYECVGICTPMLLFEMAHIIALLILHSLSNHANYSSYDIHQNYGLWQI